MSGGAVDLDRLIGEHRLLWATLEDAATLAEQGSQSALRACLQAAHDELTRALDEHIAREEVLFGDIGEAVGTGIVEHFREDHTEIVRLRDRLVSGAGADEQVVQDTLELARLVRDHQEREELVLFPVASAEGR